jgi:hypothetical protein
MTESGNTKTILIVLGALVALWGILTILDIGKRPYAGYNTDGNNTVTRVNAGGPAETAGLQAGDFIENINGISTENSAELIDLGRAAPGETRNFAVRRDGEQVQLDITYASLDTRNRNLSWAGTLIGFCYLGFCLAAFMSGQNRATGVLAIMGIGIGLAFLSGPYFESAGLRSVINTLRNALVLTGIAAMLHFLLVFPGPRPFIEKANGVRMLYAPVVLFWLLISYRILFTPAATSGLNTLTNVFAGVIVGGYFLLSIITMLRSFIRASGDERSSQGLSGMLWGTVLGLAPVAIANIIGIFSPQTVLPGSDYYFLTLILIPLTWSMAAKK